MRMDFLRFLPSFTPPLARAYTHSPALTYTHPPPTYLPTLYLPTLVPIQPFVLHNHAFCHTSTHTLSRAHITLTCLHSLMHTSHRWVLTRGPMFPLVDRFRRSPPYRASKMVFHTSSNCFFLLLSSDIVLSILR